MTERDRGREEQIQTFINRNTETGRYRDRQMHALRDMQEERDT